MTQLAHALSVGWTAFSFGATLAGIGGVGLIVLALLATAYLPAWIRRPVLAAGILLIAGAALFQAGQAKGAHDAFAVDAAKALAQAKADAAATLAEEHRQAAAAKAAASRMRDLQSYLKTQKDRACGSAEDDRTRGLQASIDSAAEKATASSEGVKRIETSVSAMRDELHRDYVRQDALRDTEARISKRMDDVEHVVRNTATTIISALSGTEASPRRRRPAA